MKRLPLKIVIFASGNGGNAVALAAWALQNPSRVVVAGLLTDNPQAAVIDRGAKLKIPVKVVSRINAGGQNISRESHEQQILTAIADWRPDWIFLAGYMRILSKSFLDNFRGDGCDHGQPPCRVVNIHPSLLPQFPGVNAYRRAFDAGVSEGGITVHIVDEGVDTGPILAQERFPRFANDNFASFRLRGQAVEHRLYAEVLAQVSGNFETGR